MVLGAAGGVGVSAVQIGKVRGAIVIAVARYVLLTVNDSGPTVVIHVCR